MTARTHRAPSGPLRRVPPRCEPPPNQDAVAMAPDGFGSEA
jgi:hypothetical protein